ncbi:MAG: 4Fe-4S ferredoxin [Bacteroidia bacterium]|nr:MAG: 4Fe-4S ferredoxin [Bacteroidia bacterium]
MKREIIKIDEDKCNGCGLCIPNCHEGALQIIDGKARLISDLMCDGLGACNGHCPEGAMEIELREAEPYDEVKVIALMAEKGRNVVTAHLKHLKDHGEFVFLRQAVEWLMENDGSVDFPVREVIQEVHFYRPGQEHAEPAGEEAGHTHAGGGCGGGAGQGHHHHADATGPAAGGGCPGSRSVSFAAPAASAGGKDPAGQGTAQNGALQIDPAQNGTAQHGAATAGGGTQSQLAQWPVQMHLINPRASHFAGSDLLLAADCVAYAAGNFHNDYLKGKTLAIACPKLDSNREVYLEKLVSLVRDAKINTLTVMKMEVPCCIGIEQMAVAAVERAGRKVPVKSITLGIRGDVIDDRWL